MHGGEGDCCVVVIGAGAGGALTASHLVTGLSSRFRVELVDPSPRHRPGHGVLDRRRPPPAQRPGERHERVPPRPRALLPLGPPAPRPAGAAAGLRPPPRLRRLHRGPAPRGGRVPRQRPPRPSPGVRRRRRPPRRPAGGAPRRRHHQRRHDRRPRRRARHRRQGRDRLGPRRAGRLGSAPRPVDRRAPRRRPAPRRHRPDHGRRRDRGGPSGPHVCTRCRATTWCRRTTCCRRHRPCRRRPASPGCTPSTTSASAVVTHVERTVAETGDWRAAIDGLRPVTAQLWRGLSDDDRRTFLADDARAWDARRHRMPPITAERLEAIDASGRWTRHTGTVATASPTDDGVAVTLSDGTELTVAGVVNCTGPAGALGQGPAPGRADPDRPRPPRPVGPGDRHGRRRSRPRGAAPDHPVLRDRHAAPRQPVGDHGDAGDPRAGVRRGPFGGACPARRDPPSAGGPVRPDPHHQPQGGATAYNRALGRLLCLQDGVESGPRVGRGRSTPASPRPTRPWPCSATSGVPSARGVRPSRPRTPRRPTAPRRPRGQLPRRRDHPVAQRRGDRGRRAAAPHPAVPS